MRTRKAHADPWPSSPHARQPNLKWTRLGCALITTLLANPDGIAFLAADKFLPQLCDCLTELDQVGACSGSWPLLGPALTVLSPPFVPKYQGSFKSDPFLSKERYAETLTNGYFEMFGTLSRHPEGIKCVLSWPPCALSRPSLTRPLCHPRATYRLLERFRLFTLFYHLGDLRSREDLVKAIINNLDYTSCARLPLFQLSAARPRR